MEVIPISESTGVQSISEPCPAEQPAKNILLLEGFSCSMSNLRWYCMSAKRWTTKSIWASKDPKPALRPKIWQHHWNCIPTCNYSGVSSPWNTHSGSSAAGFRQTLVLPRNLIYKRRADAIGVISSMAINENLSQPRSVHYQFPNLGRWERLKTVKSHYTFLSYRNNLQALRIEDWRTF